MFMPEPGGPSAADVEAVLRAVAGSARVAGIGVTGLLSDPRNVLVVTRFLAAAGL